MVTMRATGSNEIGAIIQRYQTNARALAAKSMQEFAQTQQKSTKAIKAILQTSVTQSGTGRIDIRV